MRQVALAGMVLCLALTATAGSVAAQTKDAWIHARTPNFDIVSNASRRDTERLAVKLEQFVDTVSKIFNARAASDLPVTVVAFKDDRSLRPFKPLYKGKPSNISGWFQRSDDENLIALDANASPDERPFAIIFHEYMHLITTHASTPLPLWLEEGLAEFYSSFEVQGNRAVIGAPISEHVALLRQVPIIPLRVLFSITPGSPAYNEGERQNIFYAQSWALVHYLMLSNNASRQKDLREFIRVTGAGTPIDRAFRDVFKTDYDLMEADLQRYVARDSYPAMGYTLVGPAATAAIDMRPMEEAESESALGNVLFRTGRPAEAEQRFTHALMLDADLAQPYEGLAFLALSRQQPEASMGFLKQAMNHGSRSHLAHFYYARALFEEAGARGGALASAPARAIAAELRTAMDLAPGFIPAYRFAGFIALLTGTDADTNLTDIGDRLLAARARAPADAGLAIITAQVQLRLRDVAGARRTIEPFVRRTGMDPSLARDAQAVLAQVDAAGATAGP